MISEPILTRLLGLLNRYQTTLHIIWAYLNKVVKLIKPILTYNFHVRYEEYKKNIWYSTYVFDNSIKFYNNLFNFQKKNPNIPKNVIDNNKKISISYTNSTSGKDPRESISIPWIKKARPNILFASQCFRKAYQAQKIVRGIPTTTCDLVNSISKDPKYGNRQTMTSSFQCFGRKRFINCNNVVKSETIPSTKK